MVLGREGDLVLAVVSVVAACVLLGLLEQRRVSLEGDAVAVLVDHVQSAEHVERIIDASLHVLEVKFLKLRCRILPCFGPCIYRGYGSQSIKSPPYWVTFVPVVCFCVETSSSTFFERNTSFLLSEERFWRLTFGLGWPLTRVSAKDILELLVFFFLLFLGLGLY